MQSRDRLSLKSPRDRKERKLLAGMKAAASPSLVLRLLEQPENPASGMERAARSRQLTLGYTSLLQSHTSDPCAQFTQSILYIECIQQPGAPDILSHITGMQATQLRCSLWRSQILTLEGAQGLSHQGVLEHPGCMRGAGLYRSVGCGPCQGG